MGVVDLYTQNWMLAADSVDYYARQQAPSPLQHFWSLSVQGQVFLLWPLVFAAAALIVRRTRATIAGTLGAGFAAIFAVSLTYSILAAAQDQAPAYFSTGARLWEFAAGSLLALALPFLRFPRGAAAAMSWVGLAGIVLCGVVIDVRGGFPGYLALWPVLCTAAVVAGGRDGGGWSTRTLLGSRALRFIGRDAYALYLVHWPILITWLVVAERDEAGLFGGIFVIGLSFVAARLVTWAVDAPIRRLREHPRAAVAIIGASALLVAVPLASWQITIAVQTAQADAESARTNPGAAVLFEPDNADVSDAEAPTLPLPTDLAGEWVQLDTQCAGRFAIADPILEGTCAQTTHAARSDTVIVYMGDSHMQQMAGAFLPVARERGWGVISLIVGGCAMGMDEPGADENCPIWREAAISYVEQLQPDAVVTLLTRADAGEPDEDVRPGIDRYLSRMEAGGIPVIGVRDNPRFDFDMYECFLETPDEDACVAPRTGSLSPTNPAAAFADSGMTLVDLTSYICPDDVCRPVVGNVAVYMDAHHLTRTFARTLAPAVARQLPETAFHDGRTR